VRLAFQAIGVVEQDALETAPLCGGSRGQDVNEGQLFAEPDEMRPAGNHRGRSFPAESENVHRDCDGERLV
jgi:hypothetical protein